MALIDRVKERTGTDLSDTELQAMIDAVTAEIDARLGPAGAITVEFGNPADGWTRDRSTLRLARPMDTAQAVTVVEIEPGWSGDAANETTLAADDWRALHGGRTLQRLFDGTNGRRHWAPLVRVTYTPVGVAGLRDEAVIRLMAIDVSDRGALKSEKAGDYSWTAATGAERQAAREAVFDWLTATAGAGAFPMA